MLPNYLLKHTKKISLKTRYYNKTQQLFRVDNEDNTEISSQDALLLLDIVNGIFKSNRIDCLIISDYNKGLCSEKLIKSVIDTCKGKNIDILVDPKITNILKYKGCTILKPNRLEFNQLCDFFKINNELTLVNFKKISACLDLKYLLITLDKDGCLFYDNISENIHRFTINKTDNIIDVTGAGDIFISVFAYFYLQNIDIKTNITNCNKICSHSVRCVGNMSLTLFDIDYILNNKAVYHYLQLDINRFKNSLKSKKIIFTNGCFDILHRGHIHYLKECKSMGDILIVGLNSDQSVKKLKGPKRPINNQEDRAYMLLSYDFIDYVIIFNEETPYNLIRDICPDILVKGGDYTIDNIIGKEFAKEVRTVDFLDNYSTSKLIINSII